jgi:hypothetical protein
MSPKLVTVPELFLIAGTRAALGAGIGLLLADRLNEDQRRAVGWTLLAVGVISTIPLAAEVMLRRGVDSRGLVERGTPPQQAAIGRIGVEHR